MPVRDLDYAAVVEALTSDGWKITDDPLHLSIGIRELFVDLGAERESLGAEKDGIRIAVEIKSFLNNSAIQDLAEALGKFLIYRTVLRELKSDRVLNLAISLRVYDGIFQEELGRLLIKRHQLKLMIFDQNKKRIESWKPLPATGKSSRK